MKESSIYDQMQDNRTMIAYKGEMSVELVRALMNTVEPRLKCVVSDLKIRKKMYNILMECLQNILHHQVFESGYHCSDHVTMLLVTTMDDGYHLEAGNIIANSKIHELKGWLDLINTFNCDELRAIYRAVLNNGLFSDKGTAGLGFIDIARKSGQKLQYDFQPLNRYYSLFTFNLIVPHFSLN